jgi:hypothetical protein
LKGERDKALQIYNKLAREDRNIGAIHDNYLNLLLETGRLREAESYLDRVIKKHDDKPQYQVDLGLVYLKAGEQARADRQMKAVIKSNLEDAYRIKSVAEIFAARQLTDYAVLALQEARISLRNPNLFILELANYYRLQGKREEMVNEYLGYVTQTPANIGYIKNLLQVLLTKPEELEALETLLYERVQRSPESEVFIDLLMWVHLQQKNFYGAFIQSRAYDKRFRKDYSKTFEIAQVALNNKDFDTADKAFGYVLREFAQTEQYLPARLGQIRAREARVKSQFPVVADSIRKLTYSYQKLIESFPDHPSSHEAQLSQAHLYTYYLNENDTAIQRLNKLIGNPRASVVTKAKAKLELGDVYLLKEEPWEATLLYSQVERLQKDAPIGYEAKLRNAKLSYYKADFRLAQEHLDILKQATTREIANDAIDLSMRISENLGMDSLATELREYAAIELLMLQNKMDEALQRITAVTGSGLFTNEQLFLKNQVASSATSLMQDDFYWLEANLRLRRGEFNLSLALLQKIIDQFGDEILADDASFLQAEIYDVHLQQKDKAQELYREFLTRFAGSVYAAEARKRFRTLRGDFSLPVN